MTDQIVFYEPDSLSTVEQFEDLGTLLFHVPGAYSATAQTGSADALVLVEQAGTVSQEQALQGDVVVLTTAVPPTTVDFWTGGEVFEVVSGGPRGEVGPQGPPGTQYEQTFSFPTPTLLWTLTHNRGTKALSVTAFDINGDVVVGGVDYVDNNTITIEWFYPMSGTATVFD